MTCPEHERRAAITDAEFWEHVFSREMESWFDYEQAMSPDIWAIECIRCGSLVEVDDPVVHEYDGFCEECALENEPYPEKEEIEPWLHITSNSSTEMVGVLDFVAYQDLNYDLPRRTWKNSPPR